MATRQGERDSIFGSFRMAISGIANIVSSATNSVSDVTELGAVYLTTTMNSLVDDAKHTRTIKVVENAKQVIDLGVKVADIVDYLSLRDMVLGTLDEVYEVQPHTSAPEVKAKKSKANATVS